MHTSSHRLQVAIMKESFRFGMPLLDRYISSSAYSIFAMLFSLPEFVMTICHQIFSQLEEHEKRVWSVDFSKCDPTQLASGSDDTKGVSPSLMIPFLNIVLALTNNLQLKYGRLVHRGQLLPLRVRRTFAA